ncbi:hypothetical protein [Telmatospirillum sp.]|uniref:hypothetical protein n=1 Tax=Telmatospirillum sp. TaxID=2079197 RepID=UPI00284C2F30|nr:hypothetical protein [Telmatospirillum sp.]MDR3435401.1 hypothetical protein [Telmatospirillum sp.]
MLLLLTLYLIPEPVLAQAAPRGCFSKAEENAEQIVRLGLRLREGATGCDGQPWNMHTQDLWDQVDQKLGARFAAQTQIRRGAFVREFSDDADNRLEMWNGRIVMYFRHHPLSEVYCSEVKTQLEQTLKSGWGVIARVAKTSVDEVRMDYRACPK